MKFSWSNLGKAIAGFAPALGGALGGPFGAVVGSVIAGSLGVANDPAAIVDAIEKRPDVREKLLELEYEYRKVDLQTDRDKEVVYLNEINKTMRAESESENWVQYSWRPFIGFSMGVAFLMVTAFSGVLGYRAVMNGDANALNSLGDLLFAYSVLFSIPGGVLGIASWQRGAMKLRKNQNINAPVPH